VVVVMFALLLAVKWLQTCNKSSKAKSKSGLKYYKSEWLVRI